MLKVFEERVIWKTTQEFDKVCTNSFIGEKRTISERKFAFSRGGFREKELKEREFAH